MPKYSLFFTKKNASTFLSGSFLCTRASLVRIGILALCALLCGCGLLFDKSHQEQKQEEALHKEMQPENPLPYTARFVVEADDGTKAQDETKSSVPGKKQGPSANSPEQEDAAAPGQDATDDGKRADDAGTEKSGKGSDTAESSRLVRKMHDASQLVRLKDTLPDGELGLELRANKDVETAVKIMASEGYFDGRADLHIEGADTGNASVVITMRPGIRYLVGDISVSYPNLSVPQQLKSRSKELFPEESLPGVTKGDPATADAMLKGVDKLPEALHHNGYPDAKVSSTYFYLDREKHTLNAIIDVEPGEPALIGRPVFAGNTTVKSDYLEKLVGWEPEKTIWNEDEVDDYVSRLRATGLFQKVTAARADGRNAKTDPSSQDLNIQLEEAKHRSISLDAGYGTDTGFGVNAVWEHRNLFGRAEKLNLKVPYSATERGLKADFTKPFFYSDKNILHLWGETLFETTDAYERQGVRLNASLKRNWNRYLSTETGPFADAGYLKNNRKSSQDYSVYGLSLKGTLDTRDNELNPTSGTAAELSIQPMSGRYGSDFTALGTEVLVSGYWAPFTNKDGTKSDSLVLAARVGLGAITGASLNSLPSSYRYYLGGVNTVRGYGYQQIGPMDASGDPTGGLSYQRVNLESRFKVTDSLGFVAFLDAGRLYTENFPQFDTDMDLGAGAGIRYYTPIGPLRLDVGVPLKNVDPPVQIYLSIGQAF